MIWVARTTQLREGQLRDTMPPDLNADDYCLATHEAWQFAARQMRTEEMVLFVNTKDSEESYPYFRNERHLKYRVPPFIHPQAPSTVSAAFGNFMYSKLVCFYITEISKNVLRPFMRTDITPARFWLSWLFGSYLQDGAICHEPCTFQLLRCFDISSKRIVFCWKKVKRSRRTLNSSSRARTLE